MTLDNNQATMATGTSSLEIYQLYRFVVVSYDAIVCGVLLWLLYLCESLVV